jgi:hypothetical protein
MGAYFYCEHVPARTRAYVDIEKAPIPPVSSQTQTTQQLTQTDKLPKWEDGRLRTRYRRARLPPLPSFLVPPPPARGR